MKPLIFVCTVSAALALYGAGCSHKVVTTSGNATTQDGGKYYPTAVQQPNAAPTIPDSAKNIPRPQMK